MCVCPCVDQLELGPRTEVSTEVKYDFGDTDEGDKAARLLKARALDFLAHPPPMDWDGAEMLRDKHF